MVAPVTLAALKEDSWFTDFERSSIFVQLYPAINVPHDLISRAYKHRLKLLDLKPPVKLGLIQVHDGNLTDLNIVYYSDESGFLTIFIQDIPLQLPSGVYTFLSSPLNVDGRLGDVSACRKSLDVASSLLVCLIGRAFAYSKVFEQEVRLSDGNAHPRARSHALGSVKDEDPFVGQENWHLGASICAAMHITTPEVLDRIHLSFSFLTKAIELREQGFFEYWTALEVLCAGTSPRIRAQIQKVYGWKRPHDVDKILRFDKISKMRHNMIHKGIVPDLTVGVERYMHLLFLDILCDVLDLQRNHFLLSYMSEADVNTLFDREQVEKIEGETQEPLTGEAAAVEKENFRRSWIDLLNRLGH